MAEYYITGLQTNTDTLLNKVKLYPFESIPKERMSVVRITLSEDIPLTWDGNCFTATKAVPLFFYEYMPMVLRNGTWTEFPELKGYRQNEFTTVLRSKHYSDVPNIGFLTPEEFGAWFKEKHPEFYRKPRSFGRYTNDFD